MVHGAFISMISLELKLKTILVLNHGLLITGLLYGDLSWLWLSLVGWILFGKIGGEVGLHRYFTHQSFSTTYWKSRLLLILGIFNCFGSPIVWCGVHRKHHHHSDKEADPHGHQSILRIWSTFWEPFTIEKRYIVDLLKDKWIKFIHVHYFKILLLSFFFLLLINWQIAVFLISIPAVITFHSAGLVNTICHKWGYTYFNTGDNSTNNFWVNLITLGSGLHHTHHARPKEWNNSIKWWEIDFPAFVIRHFFIQEKT
jgi:stearoyl-CoA desaturase (delta-9 desaturase)